MKFAITGATGFVGVHLIHHLLKSGNEVFAIKRPSSSLYNFELVKKHYGLKEELFRKLHWVDIELYDTNALHDLFLEVDQVIHAAGFISYNKKEKNELKRVNHEYTESLVDASISAKVKHLIYVSSTGAVAKPKSYDITESAEWDDKLDHTYYGKTKYLGELEVQRGRQEGLNISIVNPGVILGYGNWNNGSLKLFKNAYKRFPFFTSGSTGFIGVKDLCRVIVHLSQSKHHQNEQYILISENYQFGDLSKSMANHFKVREPFIEVKGWFYKLTYSFIYVKELIGWSGLLTSESTRASVNKHTFDNTKLKAALPFELQSIDEVIKEACIAYKQKRPTMK